MRTACRKILLGLKFWDYPVWRDGARKREREREKRKKKKRSNFFSDKFASTTAIIILPLFLT